MLNDRRIIVTGIALSLAVVALGSGPGFDLSWYSVDGGGELDIAGGGFELSATIGQPDAGTAMSGGDFELIGGFWAGVTQVSNEPPCEGDANGDGTVDPLDSGFVLARFGCPVGTGDPSCDAADQNGDGAVDPLDSGFVLARFGQCS